MFIDEHQDTLLDAQFGNPVGMPVYPVMWFDLPADRHNQGGCLSFADGHAEHHRWRDPRTLKPSSPDFHQHEDLSSGNLDLGWLRLRTTFRK